MNRYVILLFAILTTNVVWGQNPVATNSQRATSNWSRESQSQNSQSSWNRSQNQQNTPNRSGQFSAAEYWKQQKIFFTQKAGLTQDEADAFFPLYNELQQKKRELNREMRHIMRQVGGPDGTEEQSLKAIDAKANTAIKIAELEKEYLQKFKTVLPASKILKIQNAEEQFNSQILKDIQRSRGHQFNQNTQRSTTPTDRAWHSQAVSQESK